MNALGRAGRNDVPRAPLVLRPIRTSCVLIEHPSVTILTDPWFSHSMSGRKTHRAPALRVEELPPIDLILASHLHADHFELAAVAELSARNPDLVVVGTGGTARYCKDINHLAVQEMRPWEELTVKGVAIEAAPAKHTGPPPRELNYVFCVGGWRLFFGGDARLSRHHDEVAARCGDIDLALVPVGGTEIWLKRTTMNPADAVQACRILDSDYAMGIHEGGEWPAMLPLSRHPGRRTDFDRLLAADPCKTKPIAAGPGMMAVLSEAGVDVRSWGDGSS